MKKLLLIMLSGVLFDNIAMADEIKLNYFQQGGPANASDVNANFQTLKSRIEAQDKVIAELQKQVQEITGMNSRGVQVQPAKLPVGGISEEADDIRFTATGCKRNGGRVKCSLKVTSIDEDRDLSVGGAHNNPSYASLLYDNIGNRYLVNKASLSGATLGNATMLSRALIANIPTKLEFTIEKADKSATSIAAIEVKYSLNRNYNAYKVIRLRGIPIE